MKLISALSPFWALNTEGIDSMKHLNNSKPPNVPVVQPLKPFLRSFHMFPIVKPLILPVLRLKHVFSVPNTRLLCVLGSLSRFLASWMTCSRPVSYVGPPNLLGTLARIAPMDTHKIWTSGFQIRNFRNLEDFGPIFTSYSLRHPIRFLNSCI